VVELIPIPPDEPEYDRLLALREELAGMPLRPDLDWQRSANSEFSPSAIVPGATAGGLSVELGMTRPVIGLSLDDVRRFGTDQMALEVEGLLESFQGLTSPEQAIGRVRQSASDGSLARNAMTRADDTTILIFLPDGLTLDRYWQQAAAIQKGLAADEISVGYGSSGPNDAASENARLLGMALPDRLGISLPNPVDPGPLQSAGVASPAFEKDGPWSWLGLETGLSDASSETRDRVPRRMLFKLGEDFTLGKGVTLTTDVAYVQPIGSEPASAGSPPVGELGLDAGVTRVLNPTLSVTGGYGYITRSFDSGAQGLAADDQHVVGLRLIWLRAPPSGRGTSRTNDRGTAASLSKE
jgi:hypothetical protein